MANKSSIEFSEDEFDKTETVDNLFYLAELDINELEECKNSPSQLIKLLKNYIYLIPTLTRLGYFDQILIVLILIQKLFRDDLFHHYYTT